MNLTELTRDYQFEPQEISAISDTMSTPVSDWIQKENRDDRLNQKLSEMGWKAIGSDSSFSRVYASSDKPYVLKVNIKPDRAFAWFAFLTRKFPNTHFARIGNMKVLHTESRGAKGLVKPQRYYMYLIERLQPIPMFSNQMANWLQYIMRNPDEKFKDVADRYTGMGGSEFVLDYLTEHPDLVAATRLLGKNKRDHFTDLHSENIMQRSDGTIVIIDPYS